MSLLLLLAKDPPATQTELNQPETLTSVLTAKDDHVAKLRIIRSDMKPPVKYIPDVLNVVNKM